MALSLLPGEFKAVKATGVEFLPRWPPVVLLLLRYFCAILLYSYCTAT